MIFIRLITKIVETLILINCILYTNASISSDITYSSSEQNAISQLRELVKRKLPLDYMRADYYLIRWIRAANNRNVLQAEILLLQHIRWRQQNKIDTIQREDWSDMESDYPYTMDTHDLEGQPVGTIEVYDWDVRRAVLQGKTPRLLRYLFRLLEDITGQILQAQSQQSRNGTRFVILANADGFNLVQHACGLCLPAWIQFVRTFEAQYPGFLDELIIIQAPSTVNAVLDLVRPVISAETRNAIKVFGNNRDKWLAYLDTKISRDQRRAVYGGTKTD